MSSPEQRRKAKDARLRKVYNITVDEFYALLEFQKWLCACGCGKKFEEGKRWSVDHSHVPPYEVRGIVNYACNRYKIGSFTVEEAYRIWKYLADPPATAFFGSPRSVPPGMELGQKQKRKRRTVKRDPRGRKS